MSASAEGSETDPNLTPLLDVVLQLIMFFLLTVNFLPSQNLSKNITLPVAVSAIPLGAGKEDFVFLDMNKDGKLEKPNGELVEEDLSTPQRMKVYLSNIKDKIERAAQEETGQKQKVKIIVVVRAHEDTRSGKIIQVLDACQKAGYEDLQLRVITKARD